MSACSHSHVLCVMCKRVCMSFPPAPRASSSCRHSHILCVMCKRVCMSFQPAPAPAPRASSSCSQARISACVSGGSSPPVSCSVSKRASLLARRCCSARCPKSSSSLPESAQGAVGGACGSGCTDCPNIRQQLKKVAFYTRSAIAAHTSTPHARRPGQPSACRLNVLLEVIRSRHSGTKVRFAASILQLRDSTCLHYSLPTHTQPPRDGEYGQVGESRCLRRFTRRSKSPAHI